MFDNFEEEDKLDKELQEQSMSEAISSLDNMNAEMEEAAAAGAPFPEIAQEEVAIEAPVEQPVEAAPVPKLNRYQELLSQLGKLKPAQENYQKELSNIGIMQGVNKIAQGVAAGYGGKIDDGSALTDAMKERAAEPMNAIKRELDTAKNEMGVSTAAMEFEEATKMADPDSDISKMYRQIAYDTLGKLKDGQKYVGQLDNMSASQLSKLPLLKRAFDQQKEGAAIGFGQFVNARGEPLVMSRDNRLMNLITQREHDPADGVVRPIGYTDPTDGTRKYMGPGFSAQLGSYGNTQSVQQPNKFREEFTGTPETKQTSKPEEIKKKTYGDYRREGIISPNEFTNLVNKDKEGFEQQNAPKITIMSGLESVPTLAKEAVTNPNAAASLGGIIGSLFEPGKLTDEDALRYVRRLGLVNKAEDWVREMASGTISPKRAEEISKTASAYMKELDNIVRKNAVAYADRTRTGLIRGNEVEPEALADFYYMPKANSSAKKESPTDEIWVQGPSGSKAKMTREKAKKYLSKPGYKEVQ